MGRPPDAAPLLEAVAAALNDCETAGLRPRLRRDVVHTTAGWVLPPLGGAEDWVARFPSAAEGDTEPGDPDDMDG